MDEQKDPAALLVEELGDILGRLGEAAHTLRAVGYRQDFEDRLLKGIAFAMTELDRRTLGPLLRERPDLVPHSSLDPGARVEVEGASD